MKIYAYGQGGAHRDTPEAARWRFTTAQIAQGIRQAFPRMDADVVLVHAQDETARAYRRMRRLQQLRNR